MIESKNYLKVTCDKCGEFLGTEDVSFLVFDSRKAVLEALEEWEWQIKGNKITCNDCLRKKVKGV